jgi:aminomethyltransferase
MMMNSIAKASRSSVARRTFAAAAGSEDLVKTALYDMHKELGGEMVPFAGYELPVLFKGDHVENGGVMKEHLWCRAEGKAALFDVSHMGQVRYIFTFVFMLLKRRR